MQNKKKNRILFLFLVLLIISIGYAALTANLKINGTTRINKNTWNIYWDNIHNESGVTSTLSEIVSEDANNQNNTVNFTVTLDKPGDFYEFEVDAVNAGTLDAEIVNIEKKYNDTLIPEVEDEENRVVPAYLKYEVKYADDEDISVGDKLRKAPDLTANPPVLTKKTYKIRVEYDRAAVTNADVNNQVEIVSHSFSFSVQYGQATPVPSPVAFATDQWITIAEEGNRAAVQTSIDSNLTCGTYKVGDTKTIKFDLDGDGIDEEYTVRIANCSTPAVCETEGFSQTACGFVVEFVDILNNHRMNYYSGVFPPESGTGNMGGWALSDMRAYLNNGVYLQGNDNGADYRNSGIFSKLPTDLKKAITKTTVVSGKGWTENNVSSTEVSSVNDKLYLWSSIELIGDKITDEAEYDYTRQLDYYNSLGVNKDYYAPLIKMYNGEAAHWWLRSVDGSPFNFNAISDTGGWPYKVSTSEYGVSPAFKLK